MSHVVGGGYQPDCGKPDVDVLVCCELELLLLEVLPQVGDQFVHEHGVGEVGWPLDDEHVENNAVTDALGRGR